MTTSRPHGGIARWLSVAAAMTAIAGALVAVPRSAHALPLAPGDYVACGYAGPPVVVGSNCMSLPNAIATAISAGGQGTIYLMPGRYCPIVIPADPGGNLSFKGVGAAGLKSQHDNTGPEASLSMFVDNAQMCTDTEPGLVYARFSQSIPQGLTFDNVTFNGKGGSAYGLIIQDAQLTLRDVIVENSAGYGVEFHQQAANSGIGVMIENSLVRNNGVGIFTFGGNNFLDSSTFYGNTGYGAQLESQAFVYGDTFTNNAKGIYIFTYSGAQFLMADTAVAGNQERDCDGNNATLPSNLTNNDLLGDATCGTAGPGDIAYNPSNHNPTTPLGKPAAHGGPTLSIEPTSQELGKGTEPCGAPDGTDQREAVVNTDGPCDIGSVIPSGNGKSHRATSPAKKLNLGSVAVGQTGTGNAYVKNIGGGLVGVSSVSISGPGFTIGSDGCTYTVQDPVYDGVGCFIVIDVAPAAAGPLEGKLTIHTISGKTLSTKTIQLRAKGTVNSSSTNKLTISGGHQVTAGKRLTITTTLTNRSSHSPLTGAQVLLRAATGSGEFSTVKTVTTATSGKATAKVKPVHNTRYEWVYQGASTDQFAVSSVLSVTVVPTVRAALDHHKVKHGHPAHVYGTVSPASSGNRVTLQRHAGGKWLAVGTARVHKQRLPNGHTAIGFVLSAPTHAKGKVVLRVITAKTASNAAAKSTVLKLKVT